MRRLKWYTECLKEHLIIDFMLDMGGAVII